MIDTLNLIYANAYLNAHIKHINTEKKTEKTSISF